MISATLAAVLLGAEHSGVTLCLWFRFQVSQQLHKEVSPPFCLFQRRRLRHREVSQWTFGHARK